MHYRNRAVRLSAQQQIAEAFDDEFDPAILRFKPQIRSRSISEFLPSADPTFDTTGADTQTQLELLFGQPFHRDNRPPNGLSRIGGTMKEPVAAATTNMPIKSGRNRLDAAADTPDGLTLGGLLYGSLIGSATAALILVCLHALLL